MTDKQMTAEGLLKLVQERLRGDGFTMLDKPQRRLVLTAIHQAEQAARREENEVWVKVMPDISMCQDTDCTLRKRCYRYRAVPNSIQAYSGFRYDHAEKHCDYYWSDHGRSKLRSVKKADEANKRAEKIND